MICYRDRAFCNAECGNEDCSRNFTPAERAKARQWWGEEGAPVAFSNFRTDDCGFVAKVSQ